MLREIQIEIFGLLACSLPPRALSALLYELVVVNFEEESGLEEQNFPVRVALFSTSELFQ